MAPQSMSHTSAQPFSSLDRHSGEGQNLSQHEAWMIRFAHPFGAVLRTFSALRATSGLRRNDDVVLPNHRSACSSPLCKSTDVNAATTDRMNLSRKHTRASSRHALHIALYTHCPCLIASLYAPAMVIAHVNTDHFISGISSERC